MSADPLSMTATSPDGVDGASGSSQPIKRRRVTYACDLCRSKKNRCDGGDHLVGLVASGTKHVSTPGKEPGFRYVDDLKRRNQMLECRLTALRSSDAFNQRTSGQQSPSTTQLQDGAAAESTINGMEKSDERSTEYFGESSTFDFLAKVGSPDKNLSQRSTAAVPEVNPSLTTSSPSDMVFEGLRGGGRTDDSFELPHRSVADRLVDAYFKHRHPLNTYLHEGDFRRRYHRLWLSQDSGGEEANAQNLAWFGLVNLVLMFGSEDAPGASRPPIERSRYFKRAKTLIFSCILQTGTIELVQALLLMGQYLHGSLELENSWTVVGLAIRSAQGLGLHLDPASFTTNVVKQEIRKRVWWGCFVIDRVLSTKVGRPPTIQDGPAIQIGFPLAIDDEYLADAYQPPEIPSKLEYFSQVIVQCRLIEKILDTLYSWGSASHRSKRKSVTANTPQLLARMIELDGELIAWQNALPRHLRPGIQSQEWHFDRQRNVLLMRFLHARLLIHRQTLLFYVSRNRESDSLQKEIMQACLKRCVTAAHESITQMRLLHKHNLLSSFWHNSHYVFAALGVLLVYQTIVDPYTKADIGLAASVNIDDAIRQGMENLERVGGHMHPLASRYVQFFQKLQSRLWTMSSTSANPHRTGTVESTDPNLATSVSMVEIQQGLEYQAQLRSLTHDDPGIQDELRRAGEAAFLTPGLRFEDESELIENVLLDQAGWTNLFDEWTRL
ncbi:hypothetical protein N7510_006680 [Penicillium lagena]|uniref:uncharacterized protein n=1 Tax=Penicillium lagena TaxID=94218 RepID=UPI0025426032|nr:uncharacterized protein N7510_006680 [Penicillium lagena]KAJ5609961.1 hypothetical protein N7510_006680 [Penicillium lagena]